MRPVDVPSAVFVLGSTQPDPPPSAWPVVRRRSGGGGVLLVPGQVLWVDLLVPRADPWWSDDVGRAAHPIGELWAVALARLGLDAEVHRGPMGASAWSPVLCFAGLGPGEVTVGGRKVVGVAQRRTRAGACFQCAVSLVAPGAASVAAAGLVGKDAMAATAHLGRTAGAIGQGAGVVLDALGDAVGVGPGLPE